MVEIELFLICNVTHLKLVEINNSLEWLPTLYYKLYIHGIESKDVKHQDRRMTLNTNKGKQHINKTLNRHFNKTQNWRKWSIDDYIFYLGTSKQASDFQVSLEFTLNYIKRTFKRATISQKAYEPCQKLIHKHWDPS